MFQQVDEYRTRHHNYESGTTQGFVIHDGHHHHHASVSLGVDKGDKTFDHHYQRQSYPQFLPHKFKPTKKPDDFQVVRLMIITLLTAFRELIEILEKFRIRLEHHHITLGKAPLIGAEATVQGEEVRVTVVGIGIHIRCLGIPFTT